MSFIFSVLSPTSNRINCKSFLQTLIPISGLHIILLLQSICCSDFIHPEIIQEHSSVEMRLVHIRNFVTYFSSLYYVAQKNFSQKGDVYLLSNIYCLYFCYPGLSSYDFFYGCLQLPPNLYSLTPHLPLSPSKRST